MKGLALHINPILLAVFIIFYLYFIILYVLSMKDFHPKESRRKTRKTSGSRMEPCGTVHVVLR